jgi:hypothetical protein
VFALALICGAVVLPALRRPGTSARRAESPRPVAAVTPTALPRERLRLLPAATQVNGDTDADEPPTGIEHLHLLGAEPLLQRLPYRDRELGIALAGAAGSGKPLLLVAYTKSAAAAREDLRRVLAGLGDPGAEYAWRFRALTGG